jgi:hypothetical protein
MRSLPAAPLVALLVGVGLAAQSSPLWVEVPGIVPETTTWTNKVEVADLNGDGRPDLLFANGGDYSTPGKPEANGAYFNRGGRQPFEDRSAAGLVPLPIWPGSSRRATSTTTVTSTSLSAPRTKR